MAEDKTPEFWLRGPVAGIPDLLQPVAHGLLQAAQEVESFMKNFPDKMLWDRPAGLASPAFHLQHLSGVLDRQFTYAKGQSLSPDQFKALAAEGVPADELSAGMLVEVFKEQVEKALGQLRETDEKTLLEARKVGRNQLPSNVLGLLVHAVEHTQRHVGQLLVTSGVLSPAK
jgi:uncharacterized damage-inducible protein DinB